MVQHPFLSKSGEGPILVMSGLRLKVRSAQTDGAFEVVELQGLGSPPAHVHQNYDECFYIIKGTYTFTLATEEVEAPADALVFVPRGTPHAFKHSEGARGRSPL
jgi:mannose-6-phosphate isomerase-like protein (cupin superfamily)